MKFTIAPETIEKLMKKAGVSRPGKTARLTLSACNGHVIVESKGSGVGIETTIVSEGAVVLPAKTFQGILESYKGTPLLTFEGGPDGLKIQNFKMPVFSWIPDPKPNP